MALENHPSIDYLAIGHLACDIAPDGNQLGGTVAYAALTATALNQCVGIVTAIGDDIPLTPIEHLPCVGIRVLKSTTFENRTTPKGRIQTLHHHAPMLHPEMLPSEWYTAPLVHIGPIAHEIDPALLDCFPQAFIGLTPQGWLREWDDAGRVYPSDWPEHTEILPKVQAAVLSLEDVASDEALIRAMAAACPILVITEGAHGARLYVRGVPAYIPTQPVPEIDATGAGDIFATAFFICLHRTGDPFAAAHFATRLASHSVIRPGLTGIPTPEEVHALENTHLLQYAVEHLV